SFSPPANSGGSTITSYTVTTNAPSGGSAPGPVTVSAPCPTSHCSATVTGLTNSLTMAGHPGYTFTVTATNAYGTGHGATTDMVYPQVVTGQFNPLPPARILDTRIGTGSCTPSPCASLGGGAPETTELHVAGQGGVPATGVSAVVMNVTVVASSGTGGVLTVWPSGTAEPNVSNSNYGGNQIVPNLVTVKLGSDGGVNIANASGKIDVIADVAGWYSDGTATPGNAAATAGSRYNAVSPSRILDTRYHTGTCSPSCSTLGSAGNPQTIDLQVAGQGGIPAGGVAAVVMNVTVTNVSGTGGSSFLTAWPSGTAEPNASNLNYVDNQTVPNLVTVKLGSNGAVSIGNAIGKVDVIADVAGWYASPGSLNGSRFTSLAPQRILDTRQPIGTCTPAPCSALGSGSYPETAEFKVSGLGGVPATGVTAVVMNTTITQPNTSSFLTLWPSGTAEPNASNLNYVNGLTVANLVALKLGSDGGVNMSNAAGVAAVISDVAGWFNDGSS
ncbi:MAG: fibronectin type III domain-containing protein, partial [Actinobacteria bacterium]|nr:fibronectin type III domain-containing protein [Actinomycetota bacterium]